MIYNTTYSNQDYIEVANSLLGKSFSFRKKLQMRGVGSGRMIIANISQGIKPTQVQFSELDYGNIELRPAGIIVHFTNRLERFSWCIPFYKLHIYNSSYFSIHAEGNFINFRKNKQFQENKSFIDKMTDMKNEYLSLDYYDG